MEDEDEEEAEEAEEEKEDTFDFEGDFERVNMGPCFERVVGMVVWQLLSVERRLVGRIDFVPVQPNRTTKTAGIIH